MGLVKDIIIHWDFVSEKPLGSYFWYFFFLWRPVTWTIPLKTVRSGSFEVYSLILALALYSFALAPNKTLCILLGLLNVRNHKWLHGTGYQWPKVLCLSCNVWWTYWYLCNLSIILCSLWGALLRRFPKLVSKVWWSEWTVMSHLPYR